MHLFKTIVSQINTIIADLKKINQHIEAPQQQRSADFNPKDWVPRSKMAQMLSVSERTLRRYTAAGDLSCVRIGSQTFYNSKEVFSHNRPKRGGQHGSESKEEEV